MPFFNNNETYLKNILDRRKIEHVKNTVSIIGLMNCELCIIFQFEITRLRYSRVDTVFTHGEEKKKKKNVISLDFEKPRGRYELPLFSFLVEISQRHVYCK